MRMASKAVYRELNDTVADDDIIGVGYFNDDTQEFIHISDDLSQQYDEDIFLNIIENAFLDVWGAINQEKMYGSTLHATTRVYDDFIDTVIPLGERTGIIFIIDRDAEYQYPDIVEKIEAEVSRYEPGVDLESS